ncbi:MAG: sulfite exporter TauE/SafE family protein [Erysipelotrichaceae bacterium]|jgi:uncharacterized membrane protein YfcA|nr:sulfite exporter TauE/SafE family protein [Bacillota bacterium]
MSVIILYTIIVLIATISGAIAGLGGGVIIKPLFDLIGYHDASTIGFYSSTAVFTMCLVSIYKQLKEKFKFNIKIVSAISVGSLVGGYIGESIFNTVTSNTQDNIVKIIQAGLLGVTLILILIYTLNKEKIKQFKIDNLFIIFIVGFLLGSISVFLGIGGGPLNVATVMLLFSFDIKEASIYSIATIFFSQISKLGTVFLSGSFQNYDLSIIPFTSISAILGGYIGTLLNQKLDNKKIQNIYIFIIVVLIGISIFNIIKNLG